MPRKGVTREEVMQSAYALIEQGLLPTAANIRGCLGRGSLTTIQKYFRNWKVERFAKRQEPGQKTMVKVIEGGSAEELGELKKRYGEIEQQYRILSQELIKKEKETLKYQQENGQLSQNLQEITERYKELWLKFEHLNQAYEDLKQDREMTLKKVLGDKDQYLERLRVELKEVNENYLKAIKEVGQKGDESLIQEKIKIIHLSDQVKELELQNQDLKAQLEKERRLKQPMLGKNRDQLIPVKPLTTPQSVDALDLKRQEEG